MAAGHRRVILPEGWRRAHPGLSRRAVLTMLLGGAATLVCPRRAQAFGQAGLFQPRRLVHGPEVDVERESGLSQWSLELIRRTSAPARLDVARVAADDPKLLEEPFVVWFGRDEEVAFTASERRGLESYLRLGGILLVDDAEPVQGGFGRGARREIARILPESVPIRIDRNHVLFRTFYLLDRPSGRLADSPVVEVIVRGGLAQVIYLSQDLLGALAVRGDGRPLMAISPTQPRARELAIRWAVNLAMYVLCSDYKDDQVHAPWLMRRGVRTR